MCVTSKWRIKYFFGRSCRLLGPLSLSLRHPVTNAPGLCVQAFSFISGRGTGWRFQVGSWHRASEAVDVGLLATLMPGSRGAHHLTEATENKGASQRRGPESPSYFGIKSCRSRFTSDVIEQMSLRVSLNSLKTNRGLENEVISCFF